MSDKHYLQKSNRFLNASDEFVCPKILSPDKDELRAVGFDTKAAAVAKAEALGLDLSKVRVIRMRDNTP